MPKSISQQLQINRELSAALNSQAQRMDLISSQQRQAAAQTLQVRQALSTIIEQAQWLGSSSALGKPCAPSGDAAGNAQAATAGRRHGPAARAAPAV
ncbi:hypothetical protein M5585_00310 [Serratia ureilytica]